MTDPVVSILMDSERTNGEYTVVDCDVYIVMDSEVKTVQDH